MKRQIRITQIRSAVGRKADQKATLRALGIRRLHHSVVVEDTPVVRGMVKKVRHLLRLEKV